MSISPALSKTFEEKYALNIVIVCRGRLHIGHDLHRGGDQSVTTAHTQIFRLNRIEQNILVRTVLVITKTILVRTGSLARS